MLENLLLATLTLKVKIVSVQDNQQTTSLSWFCGIIEGEGNFQYSEKVSAREVRICNTDLDIIQACEQYLKSNFILYTTSIDNRAFHKKCYTLRIRNNHSVIFNHMEMLYNLINPKLECRLSEYQRILGVSETTRNLSIDIDWLIGVYEAEGCFSLIRNHLGRLRPAIIINNTNKKIIEKVKINLTRLNIAYYVRDRLSAHKPVQEIRIDGMLRCERFLRETQGKWVSRRNQKRTSLINELVLSRLAKPKNALYSDRELQILQTVIDLNR